jgi:hypothetical protein
MPKWRTVLCETERIARVNGAIEPVGLGSHELSIIQRRELWPTRSKLTIWHGWPESERFAILRGIRQKPRLSEIRASSYRTVCLPRGKLLPNEQ